MKFATLICFLFFLYPHAQALCVKASNANLRKGPGSKHPVSWQVGKFTPLLELQYKNGWYKVRDMDGEIHWIYKSLVTKSYQCMMVKVSMAALRKGPGLDQAYAELPSVGRYYSFRRVGFEPPWYGVEDDAGGRYWIHENLVWRPLKRQTISF